MDIIISNCRLNEHALSEYTIQKPHDSRYILAKLSIVYISIK